MTSSERPLSKRRVSIAALLSLFGAGVGHVYAGRTTRGLVIFALALAWVPAMGLAALLPASSITLYAVVGITVVSIGIGLFAIVDATLCATRAPTPYVARAGNHVGFYLLLVLISLGWSTGGTMLVRDHVFEAFRIPTASMQPTLVPGDRILVNKLRAEDLERGDLVVFREPEQGTAFIKRVVGLAGDRVEIEDGAVKVNGAPLAKPRAGATKETGEIVEHTSAGRTYLVVGVPEGDALSVEVPIGHVFLLGDNRASSKDSRAFGTVPVAQVLGVAEYVYGSRFGRVR